MKLIRTTLFILAVFAGNLLAANTKAVNHSTGNNKKIIFILSSASSLSLNNNRFFRTGVFLSEFYLPYKMIIESGYIVDFATPDGKKAYIDPGSLNNKYWKKYPEIKMEAINFIRKNPKFNNPVMLNSIIKNEKNYIGLVVPGGQGLMVDLLCDKSIPIILRKFSQNGKAIGLVCHAPALLLTMPKNNNPFIGYKVNSVTSFEEWYIESFVMGGKPANRKIANQLKKLGFIYKSSFFPGGDYAIQDRELITSQNPYSNQSFNKLYLKALNDYLKLGSLRKDNVINLNGN